MLIVSSVFDNENNPVVGESDSTSLKIMRESDGFFYDWHDSTFKSSGWLEVETTMEETSPTVAPGYYQKNVNESSWQDGVYLLIFNFDNGSVIVNGSQEAEVVDGKIVSFSTSDNVKVIAEDQKRLLGLVHENIFIDNTEYDATGNLIAARVRIYSDASSVGTDLNVIGTYTIQVVTSGAGKFVSWSQRRE